MTLRGSRVTRNVRTSLPLGGRHPRPVSRVYFWSLYRIWRRLTRSSSAARVWTPPVRGVTPEALAILETYRWPGNVRELENVMERALVLGSGDRLDAPGLPPDLRRPRDVQDVPVGIPEEGLDLEATLSQIEHRYIQMALARTGGVQTRAAELLRVSLRQIRYKLQKYARFAARG